MSEDKQVVTSFVPTTNGPLHVGHAYALLVNEEYAHSRGGRFVVRFDDLSPTAMALNPSVRIDVMGAQRDDIQWLGVRVDEWQIESQMMESGHVLYMVASGEDDLVCVEEPDQEHYQVPDFVAKHGTSWAPIPYVPWQTLQRVVLDHVSGVTHVIRGEEWATEMSLYSLFCQKLGIEIPSFIFLPRLRSRLGDDISKTLGGHSLHHCRAELAITANELKGVLRVACLRIQAMPFSIDNLLPEPRLWM
jgi:glutamyl/glutaminyl-tRNA synthetase